ncbi:hypothetical protein [Pseudoalteromonas luteoviolacea]|uniref:Uncharacterized protein n=1 Tax=Pseudoalteromonas luteoviolacea S4054 TaxID=1129367 RepID=A0A0F6AA72_9GAMM|nr:hypothetical protein [Pseudoalteromonas luteoviolacea]AOT06924.1 hypothetical protein S4054249_03100 [Pseudoalteromonas luteoviolacea]AOT11842.1 hypothetical protein S40542_03100 [Pseudoalteromonas luteoviolacea]AOT16754.1 hypothetical protein S4054_03100 [Pseudoalteromonas luteoviolacea]KKE82746.1 hypothetical protein N479_16965 [Pseudoalteromonas luteoviolacea S4054]KZN72957.1 hypothetical protein N481_13970 [Pseudoalteromonas luteoviolacea S4047-1]
MLSKILQHTHITQPQRQKETEAAPYGARHKITTPLPDNILKPTPKPPSVFRENDEDKEEKPPIITKELDEEAAGYKRRNPVFKEQYENLEKVVELIQEKIRNLQKEINELKKPPLQRTLTFHGVSTEAPSERAENEQLSEHIGSKAYKNTKEEEQIEILEQQMQKLKGQEAEIRTEMINLILEERKKSK